MEKLPQEQEAHIRRERDMNNQERQKITRDVEHLESESKRVEAEFMRGVASESQEAQYRDHMKDIQSRIDAHNDQILRLNAEDENLKRQLPY